MASVLFTGTAMTLLRVPSTSGSVTKEIVWRVSESAGGLLFAGMTPS